MLLRAGHLEHDELERRTGGDDLVRQGVARATRADHDRTVSHRDVDGIPHRPALRARSIWAGGDRDWRPISLFACSSPCIYIEDTRWAGRWSPRSGGRDGYRLTITWAVRAWRDYTVSPQSDPTGHVRLSRSPAAIATYSLTGAADGPAVYSVADETLNRPGGRSPLPFKCGVVRRM